VKRIKAKPLNNREPMSVELFATYLSISAQANQYWQTDEYQEKASYDISPVDIDQLHIDQQLLQNIWDTLSAMDRDIIYHWAILG